MFEKEKGAKRAHEQADACVRDLILVKLCSEAWVTLGQ